MATRARKFASIVTEVDGIATIKLGKTRDLQSNTVTLDDSAEGTIDRFDGNTFRSVKYVITAQTLGDSDHQTTEVLLAHDGSTATVTSYGTLLHSNNTLVSYDASINGSKIVSLLADPQISAGLKFRVQKTQLEVV